jgi:hypothetical protein
MELADVRRRIQERAQALARQRDELVTAHTARLAKIDEQLTAARALAAGWSTLTLDQAIALLNTADVQLEVK